MRVTVALAMLLGSGAKSVPDVQVAIPALSLPARPARYPLAIRGR